MLSNDSIVLKEIAEIPEKKLAEIVTSQVLECSIDEIRAMLAEPRDSDLVRRLSTVLHNWIYEAEGEEFARRYLPKSIEPFIILELHREWMENEATYKDIAVPTDSPFFDASQIALAWQAQRVWNASLMQQPILGHIGNLNDLYLSLRGYSVVGRVEKRIVPKTGGEPRKVLIQEREAFDVVKKLLQWVSDQSAADPVLVLCGGPGSGKSTLTKRLVSLCAEKKNTALHHIQLRHLNFKGDLLDAMSEYLSFEFGFPKDSHEFLTNTLPITVVLDGLDEIAVQGKAGLSAAKLLFDEVVRIQELYNRSTLKIQFLVSARDAIVPAVVGQNVPEKNIIHLLPYKVSFDETSRYVKGAKLVAVDQRQEWQQKAKSIGFQVVESTERNEVLDQLSVQPLLNHLIHATLAGSDEDLAKVTEIADIYQRLVVGVFHRYWGGGVHKISLHHRLTEKDYREALAAVSVEARLQSGVCSANLENGGEWLQKISGYEKYRMLRQQSGEGFFVLFYFSPAYGVGKNGFFEFSHKTFQEYFFATYLVEMMSQASSNGTSETDTLSTFCSIIGIDEIDPYLFEMISSVFKCHKNENTDVTKEYMASLYSRLEAEITGNPENRKLDLGYLEAISSRRSLLALIRAFCAAHNTSESVAIRNELPIADYMASLTSKPDAKGKSSVFSASGLSIRVQAV